MDSDVELFSVLEVKYFSFACISHISFLMIWCTFLLPPPPKKKHRMQKEGENFRAVTQVNRLPWPIWSREAVALWYNFPSEENEYYFVSTSIEHPKAPENPKLYVRAKLSFGLYAFLPEGTHNRTINQSIPPVAFWSSWWINAFFFFFRTNLILCSSFSFTQPLQAKAPRLWGSCTSTRMAACLLRLWTSLRTSFWASFASLKGSLLHLHEKVCESKSSCSSAYNNHHHT